MVIASNKYFTNGVTRTEIKPAGKDKIIFKIFNDDRLIFERTLSSKADNVFEFIKQVKLKSL